MPITLILEITALILGIVAVVESHGKNWAGWACIALAAVLLLH